MNEPNRRNERGQRGRVLLIDDDEAAHDQLDELLTRGGWSVLSLHSPIGATQLIARESVSAVIVDMTSPMMRGPRISSLLASWERIRDLPVLLISDQAEQAREAAGQLKRVSVLGKEQLERALLRTLERAVSMREATPSQSGVLAVRPTLRHYARSALDSWHAFLQARGVSIPTVLAHLVSLRAEAQAIGVEQTSELIALAIELLEGADSPRSVGSQVEQSVTGLLEWLVTLEPEKGLSFDRSLALNLQRARLESSRAG